MTFLAWRSRFFDWVGQDSSTRPIAILRMLTVFLLWTKWGDVGALFRVYPDPRGLLIGVLFYAFTIAMLIGYQARVATTLTALLIGYAYHVLGVAEDNRGPWVHHHTDLLKYLTWWLVFCPVGHSFSVDRWIQVRRASTRNLPIPQERAPIWGQRLIAVQLASMYLWAGSAKLNAPFLSGARMEAFMAEFYLGADIPDVGWFHAFAALLAVSTVTLELTLSVAMFWSKLQLWVLPLGMLLHLAFYMLLPVSTFSATAVAMYLAVIPPERFERVFSVLLGKTNE